MAESVDAPVSKTGCRKAVRVRVPLSAPAMRPLPVLIATYAREDERGTANTIRSSRSAGQQLSRSPLVERLGHHVGPSGRDTSRYFGELKAITSGPLPTGIGFPFTPDAMLTGTTRLRDGWVA